jgi:hypothetical protein
MVCAFKKKGTLKRDLLKVRKLLLASKLKTQMSITRSAWWRATWRRRELEDSVLESYF